MPPNVATIDQRHRHARDDRRPDLAQEREDHQHHQPDGEHQGEFDIGDRRADVRDRSETKST